ncbi:hypothetical protein CHU00_16000 [Sphingobacterium cellulitidis]|nr:hypothetical protein CHU00_16000 [Sphingobacterium cellulitidis]
MPPLWGCTWVNDSCYKYVTPTGFVNSKRNAYRINETYCTGVSHTPPIRCQDGMVEMNPHINLPPLRAWIMCGWIIVKGRMRYALPISRPVGAENMTAGIKTPEEFNISNSALQENMPRPNAIAKAIAFGRGCSLILFCY